MNKSDLNVFQCMACILLDTTYECFLGSMWRERETPLQYKRYQRILNSSTLPTVADFDYTTLLSVITNDSSKYTKKAAMLSYLTLYDGSFAQFKKYTAGGDLGYSIPNDGTSFQSDARTATMNVEFESPDHDPSVARKIASIKQGVVFDATAVEI